MPLADLLIASDDVARAGARSVLLPGQTPPATATGKFSHLEPVPLVRVINQLDRINSRSVRRQQPPPPSADDDRIAVKGFHDISFASLLGILTERTWHLSLLEQFPRVYSGGEDGPWVNSIPAEMTERLSLLSTEDIKRVAAIWSGTDELVRLETRLPGTTQQVLTWTVNLAKRAKASGKGMYLWQSL